MSDTYTTDTIEIDDWVLTGCACAACSASRGDTVDSSDLAEQTATAGGYTVDRKQVVLARPIKELGLHDVHIVLHPEVEATIQLNVARSEEEAELQASGKSIQELAAEEEAAAEFEIAELFDDIGSAASDDDDLAPAAAEEETSEDEA